MTSGLYVYQLSNIRVIDGDTIDADIDLGFRITVRKRIRLYGIDAPETRLQSKIKNLDDRIHEKKLGLIAKSHLAKTCKEHVIYLHSVGSGKYGRVLGELYYDDSDTKVCINDLMMSEGIVRPY